MTYVFTIALLLFRLRLLTAMPSSIVHGQGTSQEEQQLFFMEHIKVQETCASDGKCTAPATFFLQKSAHVIQRQPRQPISLFQVDEEQSQDRGTMPRADAARPAVAEVAIVDETDKHSIGGALPLAAVTAVTRIAVGTIPFPSLPLILASLLLLLVLLVLLTTLALLRALLLRVRCSWLPISKPQTTTAVISQQQSDGIAPAPLASARALTHETTTAISQQQSDGVAPAPLASARALTLSVRPRRGCEIQELLVNAKGYDCALVRPWTSGEAIRLEAVVEGSLPTMSELLSPLTQKTCVLYSTSVSQEQQCGMHPVTVSQGSAYVDFTVRLVDPPFLQVQLRGEDILMFDCGSSRFADVRPLSTAPAHWLAFERSSRNTDDAAARTIVGTYEADAQGIDKQLRTTAADPVLQFEECALLVGSRVTLVGELNLHADGSLVLQPWHWEEAGAIKPHGRERWRTSWELPGSVGEAGAAKVFVSDDPQLQRLE